jgi:hypothetical protein
MLSHFFPKIAPFMRERLKRRWSQRGHKWRHSMAHTSWYWISKATCTRPWAGVHVRANTHTHTHTQICKIYFISTATMIRERVSLLRYTLFYLRTSWAGGRTYTVHVKLVFPSISTIRLTVQIFYLSVRWTAENRLISSEGSEFRMTSVVPSICYIQDSSSKREQTWKTLNV